MTDHMKPQEQFTMYEYWDEPQHDPRLDSPMDMVKQYAKVTGQKLSVSLCIRLIFEELYEWEDELEKMELNSKEELKELSDLVYVIYGYANAKGWNLDEAVRRVHENNMGRMYQPDGTIKRREDGKILKNKDYPAVDLSDLV